ncbi:MAG: hypothetical protein P4L73_20685 [Caulobacteraceae bacterium]|nr:hypothetical protein [Caulobacteraceae bacterium]
MTELPLSPRQVAQVRKIVREEIEAWQAEQIPMIAREMAAMLEKVRPRPAGSQRAT